jgi:GNAT superfamily N-acetyltransferase
MEAAMRIIDLGSEHEALYFQCLEDWSEEIREAGSHKERWYRRMKGRGLRVKLALDDAGTVGGMIQYLPIEQSDVAGSGLYFIYCVWVHGYAKGRGDFQKRGMGSALLEAAEADARSLGATGMAAWGVALPFWMRAAWFRRHGYVPADRQGMMVLLWKRFDPTAQPPGWIHKKKVPAPRPGRVTVTAFINGWCPAQNMAAERARRAAAELGDRVVFEEYHTGDRAVFDEWGISDALFVDGREVRTGPPPSYERLRSIIARRLRKLPA